MARKADLNLDRVSLLQNFFNHHDEPMYLVPEANMSEDITKHLGSAGSIALINGNR